MLKRESNGTWTIDTKIKVNGEFKHFKKKGFASAREAKSEFETLKKEFIKKKELNCRSVYFDDLVLEYEKMRRHIVNTTTSDADHCTFKNYMLPYFSGKLIEDVFDRQVISIWYDNIANSPKYTNNKKSKVITRMKDLLKFAYVNEYIGPKSYQACDVRLYKIKDSRMTTRERVVWSREEERAFIKSTELNYVDNIMFRLFLECATRLGEFLALQPSCFDHTKNKITIKQQVLYTAEDGLLLTDKLKTHDSYRTIIISQNLSNDLFNYIQDLGIKDSDFLFFGNSRKTPISRTGFRRKLNSYCDIAGVRRINPHAIRHLQATKLASLAKTGGEIEACARRLGHSPSMFLNTYARHSNDDIEQNLLDKMIGQA